MRIAAILAVRNEEQHLGRCLDYLEAEGIRVCLIDNGSTDATLRIARARHPRHVQTIEHLPYRGVNDLRQRLEAFERLRRRIDADWVILHSADEIMESCRGGETLAAGIRRADRGGANVVNFEEYVFVYEDDEVCYEGTDYYRTMRSYYRFVPYPLRLMRAFRNSLEFDTAAWSGHTFQGAGIVVHPESFVLRHYIALSRRNAVRKLVGRPHPPEALARGWHANRLNITEAMLAAPDPVLLNRWSGDPRPLEAGRSCERHFWEWDQRLSALLAASNAVDEGAVPGRG